MVQPQIMKYLFSKATRARMPLSAAFEISPECNMNCKMCYVKMTPKEMEKVGRKRNSISRIVSRKLFSTFLCLFLSNQQRVRSA